MDKLAKINKIIDTLINRYGYTCQTIADKYNQVHGTTLGRDSVHRWRTKENDLMHSGYEVCYELLRLEKKITEGR